MKKLIVVLLALNFCTAMAAKHSITWESALYHETKKETTDATASTAKVEHGESRFDLDRARIKFSGTLTDMWSYNFRYRFDKDNSVVGVEGMNPGLEYGYLTRGLGEGLSLTIGKFWEPYSMYSFNVNFIDEEIATARAGALLTYEVSDQVFNLALTNTDYSGKSKYVTAFSWNGNFGMFDLGAMYMMIPHQTLSANNTYLQFGTTVRVDAFTIGAEYELYTMEKQGTGSKDTTNSNISASLSYSADIFTPWIGVTMKATEDDGAATKKISDYTYIYAGVDWNPNKVEGLTYSFQVQSKSTDYQAATTPDTSEFVFKFGVKYNFPLI